MAKKKVSGLRVVVGVLGAIAVIRALLPYLLTILANLALRKFPGYKARVAGASVDWLRGTLCLHRLSISKKCHYFETRVLTTKDVIISLRWRTLCAGHLAAKVMVNRPYVCADMGPLQHIALLQDTSEHSNTGRPAPQPSRSRSFWREKLKGLFSFQLNISIRDGAFHVRGLPGQGETDLRLNEINVSVDHLSNSGRASSGQMATIQGYARAMRNGRMMLKVKGYPLAETPTFRADLDVHGVHLPELTTFARRFAGVDLKDGLLEVGLKIAAHEGKVIGLVEPAVEKLLLQRFHLENAGGALQSLDALTAIEPFETRRKGRVAVQAHFRGSFKDPAFDLLETLRLVTKNALSDLKQDCLAVGDHPPYPQIHAA